MEHIARIFAIARRFDLDIDFHLDFDLDASWMHLDEVMRQTRLAGYGGRVAVGHATKLSAMPSARQIEIARQLADVGIAVTVLPATDLFLMGRDADYNVPRGVTRADRLAAHGVTCSLATNNVLNAFTPFGDASLLRMANLYANVAQLGRSEDFESLLRYDHRHCSAADERSRLWHRRRQSRRSGRFALPQPGSSRCRACATACRLEARPQELHAPAGCVCIRPSTCTAHADCDDEARNCERSAFRSG